MMKYWINCHIKFGMILLSLLLFISCQTEVTFTLQSDDSVNITFEGGSGDAFSKMISAAAGAEGDFLIDENSVAYELARAGFSDVKVNQKKGGTVRITMSDKKQNSYLFTSNLIKKEKDSLTAQINPKSLKAFYDSADEQTRLILDLFLSPVFNDDQMSEAEYLEMLGSFYGKSAADEVQNSTVKLIFKGKTGKEEKISIPLVQFLCGNFNY